MKDYDGLYDFITHRMDAKTTYQPVMIRTLLEKDTASKEYLDEKIRQENPGKKMTLYPEKFMKHWWTITI